MLVPGSGKTTVITNRIWNLISACFVEEKRILVITFTKKAAVEMKNRFLKIGNVKSSDVCFGTFHSVFYNILREKERLNSECIIKTSDQWNFVKEQLNFYGVSVRDENSYISDILSDIQKIKSSYEVSKQEISLNCERKLVEQIFKNYQIMLEKEKMIDFEDMMMKTWYLLNENDDVKSRWQNRFDYIMVDEFQDSNKVQYDILRILSQHHRNIFVVGDDDQSIYGFRGASPGIMKNFKADYPESAVYNLNVNYRSSGNIVKAATQLINHNSERFYKELTSFNEDGSDIDVLKFENIKSEYEGIIGLLDKYKGNFAILTRTNGIASDVFKYLNKSGVMDKDMTGSKDFFSHWIALDVLSYLRIACDSKKRSDFLRIINRPVRYISRNYFVEPDVDMGQILIRMKQGNSIDVYEKMLKLICDIRVISGLNPYSAIVYIRKVIGYEKYIDLYCKENFLSSGKYYEILNELQRKAAMCDSIDEYIKILDNGYNTDEKQKKYNIKCGVKNDVIVSTIHSAKGLEYDNVIICDVNEGIIPYEKSQNESDKEEERRLFYVAMTRAKKKLIICWVKERHNKVYPKSSFINDIYG